MSNSSTDLDADPAISSGIVGIGKISSVSVVGSV